MSPNAVLIASMLASAALGGRPTATVNFHQLVEPKTKLSPQYMEIAVMNANMEGSTTGEFDEAKWSKMTADMIQYYLEQAAEKYNMPIKLIDREHLKIAQGEKDLASAGVTDKGDAVGAAQFKGAGSILTSKVTVKVDKQVGSKRRIDALSLVGGAMSHGSGIRTEEVDQESRNITVTCQFQLKDPATNDIIVSHNAPPSQEFTNAKASRYFGSSKTEANMTPRDQVIGGMIERAVQEFLSKIVPVEVSATVTVKSSRHGDCEAGVNAMVMEDYQRALGLFKGCLAKHAKDDCAMFGAGVCCEKLKMYDEAKRYYRQAQSYEPNDPEYNAAVARISHMGN